MAFPSDSARTKNWGTEILTDADLEGQLDILHNYFVACLNSTTGHSHDGTSNQGPKINITNLTVSSQATGDIYYASSASANARLGIGASNELLRVSGGLPDWQAYTSIFLTPKEYTDVSVTDTTDRTTTSSTYGDVTSETSTFTVGKEGLVFANYSARADSASGIGYAALLVDGTVVAEAAFPSGVAGNNVFMSYQGVLTAASHTIKIQLKNTDNSSTMTLKNTVQTARLRISHPS